MLQFSLGKFVTFNSQLALIIAIKSSTQVLIQLHSLESSKMERRLVATTSLLPLDIPVVSDITSKSKEEVNMLLVSEYKVDRSDLMHENEFSRFKRDLQVKVEEEILKSRFE